jgi:hypothetical protein
MSDGLITFGIVESQDVVIKFSSLRFKVECEGRSTSALFVFCGGRIWRSRILRLLKKKRKKNNEKNPQNGRSVIL